jgi:tetratricopeptide (TPR) repeat protein
VRVVANNCLGDVHFFRGDFRGAIEFHRRNRDSLHGDFIQERFGLAGAPAVFSRVCIAWCLTAMGQLDDALASALEATRIAEALRHPYSRIWADIGVGDAYLQRGDFAKAIQSLEGGLGLCQATDIRVLSPYLGALLGSAYAHSGRPAEAIPLIERAVDTASALRVGVLQSLLAEALGEAYLISGRAADAAESARRALELSRAHEERGFEARSLRLLGEIELSHETPDLAIAEDYYVRAMALGVDLGMRPLVAHCNLGLGKLCRLAEKRQRAQKHLNTATGMYRDMEMRYWLERADAD